MKVTKVGEKGLALIKLNRFYVYFHINPLSGKVFYIGKGCGNRAYVKKSRNAFWHNTVNKYGIQVVIVSDNLFQDEAILLEKKLISLYGLDNLCNMMVDVDGCLFIKDETREKMSKAKIGNKNAQGHTCNNLENKEKMKHFGNKNMLGKKHTEESKSLISKNLKGKTISIEARLKQSESMKLAYKEGRMVSHNLGKLAWNKGVSPSKETLERQRLKKIEVKRKPHSEETKEKMRLAALNRK
jgi:hypothetical protein